MKNLPTWMTTITPASKIIAGVLFISLPFLGFFLGVSTKPSKIGLTSVTTTKIIVSTTTPIPLKSNEVIFNNTYKITLPTGWDSIKTDYGYELMKDNISLKITNEFGLNGEYEGSSKQPKKTLTANFFNIPVENYILDTDGYATFMYSTYDNNQLKYDAAKEDSVTKYAVNNGISIIGQGKEDNFINNINDIEKIISSITLSAPSYSENIDDDNIKFTSTDGFYIRAQNNTDTNLSYSCNSTNTTYEIKSKNGAGSVPFIVLTFCDNSTTTDPLKWKDNYLSQEKQDTFLGISSMTRYGLKGSNINLKKIGDPNATFIELYFKENKSIIIQNNGAVAQGTINVTPIIDPNYEKLLKNINLK